MVTTSKKKPVQSETSSDTDSSSEDEDPNTRRALLGEFRRRYKYNIPMFHQFSEAMCDTIYTTSVKHNKRMRKEHEKRTISFFTLREVVVILDNKKLDENRQLDTSGKTLTVVSTRWLKPRGLKIKKISPSNNYASSGACFLGYLKNASLWIRSLLDERSGRLAVVQSVCHSPVVTVSITLVKPNSTLM